MPSTLTNNEKFQKSILSGSASGRRIKISATASPGTTVHTGPDDVTMIDEVWLHVYNADNVSHTLTVEYGGTTAPDDVISYTLAPKESRILDVSGCIIQGAATPLVVRAYADTANIVTVGGYITRAQ